jgi:putative hydrolase of the HAD superfamily
MKEVEHIFFDLDRTLWDFEKNSEETLQELFIEFELDNHIESFNHFYKKYIDINKNLWKLYRKSKITKEELRYKRFEETLKKLKVNQPNLGLEIGEEYIVRSPRKTNLISGTKEVLEYLNEKYSLHIITNGFKEVQYIKLNNSGISTYFQNIIISEEVGYNKPHIKIFRHAESLAKTSSAQCLMIGDDFEPDVKGALNAGWKAIYFDNSYERINKPGIKKLIELKDIL